MDMILSLLLAAQIGPGSRCPILPESKAITVGWHDEMTSARRWQPLSIDNKARVADAGSGQSRLSLGHVPEGWPYQYQWSGVSRDMRIDISRFPVLMAFVPGVHGYAHMDIDVLDARGKAVRGFRSSTLTAPGVSQIDLGESLDPAIYNLRVRLIVGGPNEGCQADYDWVRFAKRADAAFFAANPGFTNVQL